MPKYLEFFLSAYLKIRNQYRREGWDGSNLLELSKSAICKEPLSKGI